MTPAFCRCCGSPLVSGVPEGEDRPREHCTACGHIEYRNPRVRAGCVAALDGGAPVLRTVLLRPGERLQAGALRAMGALCNEEQLLLYCAITDRSRAEVSLVFRVIPVLAFPAPDAPDASGPEWEQSLLGRFMADLGAGVVPVYTAEATGAALHMNRVPGS